jgi:hypothetical protein
MQGKRRNSTRHSAIKRIILGRLVIAGLLGSLVLCGLIRADIVKVPGQLDPFAPLRVADGVNWLTRIKLSRLERNAPQCLAALAESRFDLKPASVRDAGDGCGFSNAVEVLQSTVTLNESFTATCPLAVSWALLEMHVLLPAAREHLGQEVSRVVHLGTYACRNINHRAEGRRSEHAAANAIDVSAFVLSDGQRITVKDDWMSPDSRKRSFLRAVRDGACGVFDVVLGPEYNEAHRDHFHMDMGAYRACR